MPEFQYRALDPQGREVRGSLNALNANAAMQSLGGQGLRVKQIQEGVAVPSVAQPRATVRTEPRIPQKINPLQQPATQALPKKRTSPSTNGELFFLFAQLSNLFRGGIAPSEALVALSQRNPNKKFVQPLMDMAAMTTEGRPLSDALETYPDLFHPGVVGAVRAGEKGGYLAEACGVVSDQCKETHKLQRLFWWVGIVVIMTAISFAAAFAMTVGVDRAIAGIDNPEDARNTLMSGLKDAFLGIVGVSLLAFFVVYFLVKRSLKNPKRMPQRHRIALAFPIVGNRAKAENLALFSWHLNQLGNAGLAPFQAWGLAADAVPNIEFSKRLQRSGKTMNESTRYSTMFYESDLVPREIAAVMETGEMTGNMASSLEQAMDYSRSDQKMADTVLKAKAGCWMALMIIGGGLIALLIVYGAYGKSAIDRLDPFVGKGMGEPVEEE